MLTLKIESFEGWDEEKEEFIYIEGQTIHMRHCLASISKWESKWHIPFLSRKEKTEEQALDYIRCMVEEEVSDTVINIIQTRYGREIESYMNNPSTATVVHHDKQEIGSNSPKTSEVIYSWMFQLNIPMECQYWHINKLITQIDYMNEQQKPPKKISKKDAMARQARINAERRAKLKSKG